MFTLAYLAVTWKYFDILTTFSFIISETWTSSKYCLATHSKASSGQPCEKKINKPVKF